METNNELMEEMMEVATNEVAEEAVDVIESTTTKSCAGKVAGIGIGVIVGVLAYKKFIKPYLAKKKAAKEIENTETEFSEDIENETEIQPEENN